MPKPVELHHARSPEQALRRPARRTSAGVFALLCAWSLPTRADSVPRSVGIYATTRDNTPVPRTILTHPDVDGVLLRYTWDRAEPAEGTYDWAYLDQQIAAAAANGKKVAFNVRAGTVTPGWVYAGGAAAFTYLETGPYTPNACETQRIPVPWDPVFLAKYTALVAALGARYAGNPTVSRVGIEGINVGTEETALPRSKGSEPVRAVRTGRQCTSTDDVREWTRLGYTRLRVENAWTQIAQAYDRAFPKTPLVVQTFPGAAPPIDDAGSLIRGQEKDQKFSVDILHAGRERLGSRFVAQNNGLSGDWVWEEIARMAPDASTGYQMLWLVTNDETCRMNRRRTPCDPVTDLKAAIDNGIARHADYLEIYTPDLLNPALRKVLDDAHRALQR
jgi:hypothetical protein